MSNLEFLTVLFWRQICGSSRLIRTVTTEPNKPNWPLKFLLIAAKMIFIQHTLGWRVLIWSSAVPQFDSYRLQLPWNLWTITFTAGNFNVVYWDRLFLHSESHVLILFSSEVGAHAAELSSQFHYVFLFFFCHFVAWKVSEMVRLCGPETILSLLPLNVQNKHIFGCLNIGSSFLFTFSFLLLRLNGIVKIQRTTKPQSACPPFSFLTTSRSWRESFPPAEEQFAWLVTLFI